MQATSLVGLFALFFPLIVLIVLAVVLRVIGSRVARHRRVSDVACGSCRYLVRGIDSEVCPECGAALREVGVLLPAMRGMRKQPLATWIEAVWVGLIVLCIVPIVGAVTLAFSHPGHPITVKRVQFRSPASNAYGAVELVARSSGAGASTRFDEVTLTVTKDGRTAGPALLDVLRAGEGGAPSQIAFDPAELRAAFVQAGVNANDADVREELRVLQQYAAINFVHDPGGAVVLAGMLGAEDPRIAGMSDVFRGGGGGSMGTTTSREPRWAILAAVVAAALIVWASILLLRRSRRRELEDRRRAAETHLAGRSAAAC